MCVRAYAALHCLSASRLRVTPLAAVEALSDLCAVIMEVGVIQLGIDDQPLLDDLVLQLLVWKD